MNRELYLEFASRSGEFLFRQRLPALPATVGRSLQNDVVVDDPYVAASHLEISADPELPGGLLVRDLGSRNGLFLNRRRVFQTRLASGQTLHFGHTTLRLRNPEEPVAPERVDAFASPAFSLAAAMGVLALIALIAVIQKPLNQFTEITAKAWLLAVLAPVGAVAVWASVWAMATRLFAGHSQFGAHLAITAWSVLGIELVSQSLGLAAYAFSASWLVLAVAPATALVGAWAFYRQLSLAQLRWPRANLPLTVLLTLLPLSLWTLSNWEARGSLFGEPLVNTLYLPRARVVGAVEGEAFVRRAAALRADVDVQAASAKDEDGDDAFGED